MKPFKLPKQPKMKPLRASLTCCQRMIPGIGLRMGMERSGGPTPPPPGNPDFLHILITGQSLAVGVSGLPLISLTQPYSNIMFAGGVRAPDDDLASVVPLVESSETDPVNPLETDGETIASGMANQLSVTSDRKIIASCSGLSGAVYAAIKQGTETYDTLIAQAAAAQVAVNSSLGVDVQKALCVAILHGEANQAFEVPNYNLDLAEWRADLNTDIQAATGKTNEIPIFIYQQCNVAPASASSTAFATALKALQAARADPSNIILIGPNFPWLRADGIHLWSHGYRGLGCLFARLIKRIMLDGGSFLPFAPNSITRSGATIDAVFDVPEPPIAFDLATILNPGNYGFSYKDDNDDTTISSVSILNDTAVRIVLSGTPTGANKRLRYGFTSTGSGSGPFLSGRGNLCDSGATANIYGYKTPMKNWACLFDDPIPYAS